MKQVKFSAPDELREQIKSHARKEDMSESQLIRRALRQYLESNGTKEATP